MTKSSRATSTRRNRKAEGERLRHADGLVGRKQRGHVRVVAAEQLHHGGVLPVREAEAAVLARDLHTERADGGEPFDHLARVLPRRVDGHRIDPGGEERAQLVVERLKLRARRGLGERMHEVEAQRAEEQIAEETATLPLRFASSLGHASGPRLGLGRRVTPRGRRVVLVRRWRLRKRTRFGGGRGLVFTHDPDVETQDSDPSEEAPLRPDRPRTGSGRHARCLPRAS